jgi:predicted anti-sigma-YlaC factor YlaD
MTAAHSSTVTRLNNRGSVAASTAASDEILTGSPPSWGGNGLHSERPALPQARTPWGAGRATERLGQALGFLLLLATLALSGCSLQRFAANRLGDALAGGSSVYATDDDPDLVAAAMPFGLKTIESLLVESPHHKGLLLSASSGFTQYAYAFVQTPADFVEDTDLKRATALREQAGRLYRRALGYGLRGLEEVRPNLLPALRTDPQAALARFRKADVPQLYWTAAAWGAAISLNKTDSELGADLPLVEALMHRALELDEGFGLGAIYDFYIAYDGGRPAAAGGSVEQARASLARALQLSGDHRAAPLVSFAETVDVGLQDRAEFEKFLNQALAIDVNALPEQRLANLIAQKRARWLLGRMDRLFLE